MTPIGCGKLELRQYLEDSKGNFVPNGIKELDLTQHVANDGEIDHFEVKTGLGTKLLVTLCGTEDGGTVSATHYADNLFSGERVINYFPLDRANVLVDHKHPDNMLACGSVGTLQVSSVGPQERHDMIDRSTVRTLNSLANGILNILGFK